MKPTRVRARPKDPRPARLAPRKAPQQARSRALVDALVEAAARVLVERRLEGFTMQLVAERAGVSPGSLYQYFPDRDALLAELIERQSERERAFQLARLGALAPDATLLEALDFAVDGALEFQRVEGALLRETLRAMPLVGRYAALSERVAQVAALFEALLEARRHELPPGAPAPRVAAHVLVNAVHSLTHDGVLARPPWLDEDTLRSSLRRLVRGFLLGPHAPSA